MMLQGCVLKLSFSIGSCQDLWVNAFKTGDKIYFVQTVLSSCSREVWEVSVSIETWLSDSIIPL